MGVALCSLSPQKEEPVVSFEWNVSSFLDQIWNMWVRAQQTADNRKRTTIIRSSTPQPIPSLDWATQNSSDECKQLGHINTEEMNSKEHNVCPCSLSCSLMALSIHSVSRGTAATPKQISWNRSAWRRSRIPGERNKVTEAVGQNLCIIAEKRAAYHRNAYLNTSTKCPLTTTVLFLVNTRNFHSTTRKY